MDYSSFFDNLGSGINLLGQLGNMSTAGNVNNQVQTTLGQNSSGLADQIAALQRGFQQGGQQAQDAYNQTRGLYDTQNQQLQGNIDTMTQNLNALNDPNSPYMQMARQKIERADAAAGRRSQAGEREVQLAAMLADYVGKYAPGLNNSITSARNQIQGNQNSLAQLYAQMQNAATAQGQAATQALAQQQALAQAQNTTGRQAANSNTSNTTAALQAALGFGKGLAGMFGNFTPGGDGGTGGWGVGGDNYNMGYNPFGGGGITSQGGGTLGGFDFNTGGNNYLGGSGNLFGDYSGGVDWGF